jgi:protein involved in polysaccharide export with SLBB domain
MRSAKVLLALAAVCATAAPPLAAQQKQQPKVKTEAQQPKQQPQPDQKQQPAATNVANSAAPSSAADPQPGKIVVKELNDNYTIKRDYVLGPNDTIELRVFDEPQLNGDFEVDADGNILFPFVEQPLVAQCRTINDLRKDLTVSLSKFLKNPRVFLRVKDQRSHKPAFVYGAVRQYMQFDMRRPARLLELVSNTGGVTEQHSGTIQIMHTEPATCGEPDATAHAPSETDDLGQPYSIYKVSDLRLGKADANPYIRNGDIVYVAEASPIYVVGNVTQPTSLYLKDGMTLTRVIAMVGGMKAANEEKVLIRRLKPGSSDAELLTINFKAIRQGKAKDVDLEPYDIIVVPKQGLSSKTVLETVTGLARGSVASIATNAPLRILY